MTSFLDSDDERQEGTKKPERMCSRAYCLGFFYDLWLEQDVAIADMHFKVDTVAMIGFLDFIDIAIEATQEAVKIHGRENVIFFSQSHVFFIKLGGFLDIGIFLELGQAS